MLIIDKYAYTNSLSEKSIHKNNILHTIFNNIINNRKSSISNSYNSYNVNNNTIYIQNGDKWISKATFNPINLYDNEHTGYNHKHIHRKNRYVDIFYYWKYIYRNIKIWTF